MIQIVNNTGMAHGVMLTRNRPADLRAGFPRFPDPVNEISARLVAFGVLLLASASLLTHQHWLLVPLTYGFAARVLSGPAFSPLGLLVTRVVTPRLPVRARLVPGPPKRFAQAMGLAFSSTALVLDLGLGFTRPAGVVLGLLIGAASLEAFLGICLGCRVFALLMRLGVVPEAVCERCNSLSLAESSA